MTSDEAKRRAQVGGIWGEREAMEDHMNAERRARWEARKLVIFEADLPPSSPKPPAVESAAIPFRKGRTAT